MVVGEEAAVDAAQGGLDFDSSAIAVGVGTGGDGVVTEARASDGRGVAARQAEGAAVHGVVAGEQAVGDNDPREVGRVASAVDGSAAVGGLAAVQRAVAQGEEGLIAEDGSAWPQGIAARDVEAVEGEGGVLSGEELVGAAAGDGDDTASVAAVAAVDGADCIHDGGEGVGEKDDGSTLAEVEGDRGRGAAGDDMAQGFAQRDDSVVGVDGVQQGSDDNRTVPLGRVAGGGG